jgi:hypothetical protein
MTVAFTVPLRTTGDPKGPHHRDANPYPRGSEEHQAWDCGYIGASTKFAPATERTAAA